MVTGLALQPASSLTIEAGRLNRRIRLQRPLDVPDGAGGYTRTWQDVATLWAYLEPKAGREQWQLQQVYPIHLLRVILRYSPSLHIDESMRLVYRSQPYNIRSVTQPGEAHTVVELLCEALPAQGVP
jgi:SPP1 family predicted phage head-tail adaptor